MMMDQRVQRHATTSVWPVWLNEATKKRKPNRTKPVHPEEQERRIVKTKKEANSQQREVFRRAIGRIKRHVMAISPVQLEYVVDSRGGLPLQRFSNTCDANFLLSVEALDRHTRSVRQLSVKWQSTKCPLVTLFIHATASAKAKAKANAKPNANANTTTTSQAMGGLSALLLYYNMDGVGSMDKINAASNHGQYIMAYYPDTLLWTLVRIYVVDGHVSTRLFRSISFLLRIFVRICDD